MKPLSELALRILKYNNAQELMDALSPSNSLWGPEPTDWIFRGHGNSKWKLLPSALRPGELTNIDTRQPILDGSVSIGTLEQGTATALILHELQHVREFFDICDDHGLHIPGDSHEHRTIEGLHELGREIGRSLEQMQFWPPGPWLQVYALAQHYGIKTRFLDWTRMSRVAAYFAARGVAEEIAAGKHDSSSLSDNKTCIWALNKRKLQTHYHLIFPQEPAMFPYLRLVTTPQASNPNLRAQAGLFTVDGNPKRRIPLDELILGGLDDIEDQDSLATFLADPFILTKIELPYRQTRTLLKLLAKESVNSASVYPGYQGAASALFERAFWE